MAINPKIIYNKLFGWLPKLVGKWVARILLLLVVFFVLTKFNVFNLGNLFNRKPLSIQDTPVLITQVKEIAQLFTTVAYHEVAHIYTTGLGNSLADKFTTRINNKVVYIIKGKTIVGVDLKKMTNNDIIKQGEEISINLPAIELLEVIANPSDFEMFSKSGYFTEQELVQAKMQGVEKIKQEGTRPEIVKKAEDQCKYIFTQFLTNAGFKKININFKTN
jgi:hypothetical protein